MLAVVDRHAIREGFSVYNLGTDETVTVDDSIATITGHLGMAPEIEKAGGRRGWPGDSPLIHLDTAKVRGLGWRPQLTIREAIVRTLDWFEAAPYILDSDQEGTVR
jgi:UDP-glucose 4-epimerase